MGGALDEDRCTAHRTQVTGTTGASETWQARITHELAAQLREDAELLGPDGRTEIVRTALGLLHARAAQERMARGVDSFCAGREPELPSACTRPAAPSPCPTTALPEPFRGEVWDVDVDDVGLHPAVVLSIDVLNARLGHVAVIPVTGTRGPDQTHVPLDADAVLTRYAESDADATGLQPVARSRLVERRGLLATTESDRTASRQRSSPDPTSRRSTC